MTLADAVNAALPGFRADAASLMVDACTIRRPTGPLDPGRGYEAVTETVYSGPCKVQTYESHETVAEVGGGTATVQRYAVHVPVGAFQPATRDVVTIDACTFDPNLVGREFVVRALLHKSYATAYRLGLDDVTGYGES